VRELLRNRFWAPPLLRDQPRALGLLNVFAPPLLWGMLCGLLCGISRIAFIVGLVLSLIGAFGAGRQHLGILAGTCRGGLAGALFGGAILAGRGLGGGGTLLFHLPILQVVFTGSVAAFLGALGGLSRLRERGAAPGPGGFAGAVSQGD
jgi:hypothetical protein